MEKERIHYYITNLAVKLFGYKDLHISFFLGKYGGDERD